MKTDTTQIGIRISNDLLEKIKIMAGKEDRSVTNMIIHLLKSQLKDRALKEWLGDNPKASDDHNCAGLDVTDSPVGRG